MEPDLFTKLANYEPKDVSVAMVGKNHRVIVAGVLPLPTRMDYNRFFLNLTHFCVSHQSQNLAQQSGQMSCVRVKP